MEENLEESLPLESKIKCLLDQENFEAINQYFEKEELKMALIDHCGNILPLICEAMMKDKATPIQVECCSSWLDFFCKNVPPKEALIYILEEFEKHTSAPLYVHNILPHLKLVLLRMPNKRGVSLQWVLDTLSAHLTGLDLPQAYNFEGDERKLLDLDPQVQVLMEILPSYTEFLAPFVEEVSLTSAKSTHGPISQQRLILKKFVFRILWKPLSFLDLHNEEGHSKSTCRVVAEKFVKYLSHLDSHFMVLFDNKSFDQWIRSVANNIDNDNYEIVKMDPELEESFLSSSTLAYLLLAERCGVEVQLVYNPIYLFLMLSKYSISFLVKQDDIHNHKGLLLTKAFLQKLSPKSLNSHSFELPETILLPRCLFRIMVFSQVKEHRMCALQLFQSLVLKFEDDACSRLLISLYLVVSHSGVKALILNLYKNYVHAELLNDKMTEYAFIGFPLLKLVKLAVHLPNDVESDLLKHSDEILGTLNFLRYLYSRDKKPVNKTGIWILLDQVKTCYLDHLRTGLNLSRAHYELQLKNPDNQLPHSEVNDIACTFNVNSQMFPSISLDQQKEALQNALTMFDMMESVIVCLEEIINAE